MFGLDELQKPRRLVLDDLFFLLPQVFQRNGLILLERFGGQLIQVHQIQTAGNFRHPGGVELRCQHQFVFSVEKLKELLPYRLVGDGNIDFNR